MRGGHRRYVHHEVPRTTPDGAGGFEAGWLANGGLWVELRERSRRLRADDLGPASELRARIVLRAAPDGHPNRVEPGDRFRELARVWIVEAVHQDDGRQHCDARAAAPEAER